MDRQLFSAPERWASHHLLGVAEYRAGNAKAAVVALKESMRLRKGGDAGDWFFLAMAHHRLGDVAEAKRWYDRAVAWVDLNAPDGPGYKRLRAEAGALLGVRGGTRKTD